MECLGTRAGGGNLSLVLQYIPCLNAVAAGARPELALPKPAQKIPCPNAVVIDAGCQLVDLNHLKTVHCLNTVAASAG
jgi:hypothetical protein